jgi:hypothetical protein
MRKSEKGIEKSDPSSSDRAGLCRGKHAEGGKERRWEGIEFGSGNAEVGRWKAEFGMRKW